MPANVVLELEFCVANSVLQLTRVQDNYEPLRIDNVKWAIQVKQVRAPARRVLTASLNSANVPLPPANPMCLGSENRGSAA